MTFLHCIFRKTHDLTQFYGNKIPLKKFVLLEQAVGAGRIKYS
jgi:hypothetical protein